MFIATLILEKDRDDPCCESGEDKLKLLWGIYTRDTGQPQKGRQSCACGGGAGRPDTWLGVQAMGRLTCMTSSSLCVRVSEGQKICKCISGHYRINPKPLVIVASRVRNKGKAM